MKTFVLLNVLRGLVDIKQRNVSVVPRVIKTVIDIHLFTL